MSTVKTITTENLYLGIEFGSTRIKAVLVDASGAVIASGGHGWENHLENGIWTYSEKEILEGLQAAYGELKAELGSRYGIVPHRFGAVGVSAMMHGYLVFGEKDELLTPFRTWRNTITEEAADLLTEEFRFNIPQRWSIAHLYQAVLNQEEHVNSIRFMTTLAGYIHWKLTGEKVLGIGDASGMFPIDSEKLQYDQEMLDRFDRLTAERCPGIRLGEILPKPLAAGEAAGTLTEKGALLLDPSGDLEAGIPMCPPEGDAGTGMVATDSVAVRTGNVSAGTSVFGMIVLEHALKELHREIDMVTTPDGHPVAMAHVNNCTSEMNAWMGLFREVLETMGMQDVDMGQLYSRLFRASEQGDLDCGGLLSYGFFSGEHMMNLNEGRPLFVRKPDSAFTLANFMRAQICTAFGALKMGMDILREDEGVNIDVVKGHGGIFKTPGVAQKILSAALHAPVAVMDNAGEGGAWGIAVLAAYLVEGTGRTLPDYLENVIFKDADSTVLRASEEEEAGFEEYMKLFRGNVDLERSAIKGMI